MKRAHGFILLGIVIFISIIALAGMATVLEQDTKLKRFKEEELRLNLSAIRRGIDLYRYKYTVTQPDSTRIAALESALQAGNSETVVGILAGESFLRARVATGSMEWRVVENLIKNSSFEIDDGTDFGFIGTWRGNSLAGDQIPDGWQIVTSGFEQLVSVDSGTFVISAWVKSQSSAAGVRIQVWGADSSALCDFTADSTDWKRYFASFSTAGATNIRVLIVSEGTASGETAEVDGVMLEKWNPPSGVSPDTPPVPSAWTVSKIVVPAQAETVLQQRLFSDAIPADATPASLSWWFQW